MRAILSSMPASVAVIATLVSASPSAAAQSAAVDTAFPVVGQQWVMGTRDAGTPAVVSLHAVRRTSGPTVVYYSIGLPQGSDLGGKESPWFALSASMGGSINTYSPVSSVSGFCDVAVADNAGAKLYAPVTDGVCTKDPVNDWDAGKAYVFAVGVAPLPAGVDTVDVSVRGAMFQDVPVTQGALAPQAEDKYAPVFGVAWPQVDVTQVGTDPQASVYPLVQSSRDLQGAVTTSQTSIDLNSAVLFAHDSAEVTPAGVTAIEQAAATLKERAVTGSVSVVGHTDSDGDDAYNLDLSKRRAQAVAVVLTPLLPSGVTLTTDGKGEAEPITDNSGDAAKALNRRVTLTFVPGADS